MFQLIARHLLHTLNIIVVESFTTPHHYCPMSVQPLPALTVTDSHEITLYEYDGRNLVTKEINALGDSTVYVYDGNG